MELPLLATPVASMSTVVVVQLESEELFELLEFPDCEPSPEQVVDLTVHAELIHAEAKIDNTNFVTLFTSRHLSPPYIGG